MSKFKHNTKLVYAVMAEAKKSKNRFAVKKSSPHYHKNELAFYAYAEYELLRESNENLPPLKQLSKMADEQQHFYSFADIKTAMHEELEALGKQFA